MKHQAVQQPKGSASPFLFCGANFSFLFSVDEIVCTLGEGAFGKVVECIDHSKYENIPYSSIEIKKTHYPTNLILKVCFVFPVMELDWL